MIASDTTALFPPPGFVQAQIPEILASSADGGCFSFADTPQLTSALRAGDEEAFRWLHARWNSRLVRYCFALAAGDAAVATELAQATYLRVFRHIRALPDEAALWSWLACAARSAACDLHRTGGRYRRALERFAEWLPFRQPLCNQPSGDSELLAALDVALAKLTADERQLVEARYFHRRPLEEIGARFGISARAAEGRLARVRIRLRELVSAALRRQIESS